MRGFFMLSCKITIVNRYTSMIVFTTSTGTQDMFFIPRIYDTTNVEVVLTDDITLVDATNTAATFTRTGDYIKAELAYSNLKEDRFYTVRVKRTTDNAILYKDKLFVTNQVIDQVNNNMYSINKDEYIEKETSSNDYIVI